MKSLSRILSILLALSITTAFAAPVKLPSNLHIKGWPDYLAMGIITINTQAQTNTFKQHKIDAQFTYSSPGGMGSPGKIITDWTKVTKLLANTEADNSIPVLVYYTTSAGSGGVTSLLPRDISEPNLHIAYMNLINFLNIINKARTTTNKTISVIVNPDLLGAMQQTPYSGQGKDYYLKLSADVNDAIQTAFKIKNKTGADSSVMN